MKKNSPISASVILAAVLCAGAAQADVTPEQVWQEWKDYYASMGGTITAASETRDGDALVVKDVKWSQGTDATVKTEMTMPEIRLTDKGDGTVEMTIPEEGDLTVAIDPADGKPSVNKVKVAQKGLSVIASGTVESMDYTFAVPDLTFSIDKISADGKEEPVSIALSTKGASGTSHVEKSGGRTTTGQMKADQVTMTLKGAKPETKEDFDASFEIDGVTTTSSGTMPETVAMSDINAAMQGGFATKGDIAYASAAFKFSGTGSDGNFAAEGGNGGGKMMFAMSKDGIAYSGESSDGKISVTGPMPFPVEASVAQSAFNIAMPIMKSDDAKPASMLVKLVDLTVSDALWNMADPAGKLPHDPATLVLDLSGSLKPLIDLFDPKQAEAFAKNPAADGSAAPAPFELSAVKINELHVKAVGADLTGTGDLTLDNSSTPPKPVGTVELNLTGANKLMDGLVAMGLLPEDQVMGYKMMLGMFTVPKGDDAVTSKLEFKDDGGIYANGQRLQ